MGLMVPLYDLSVWSTGIVDIKTYETIAEWNVVIIVETYETTVKWNVIILKKISHQLSTNGFI